MYLLDQIVFFQVRINSSSNLYYSLSHKLIQRILKPPSVLQIESEANESKHDLDWITFINFSLISQENIPGCSFFNCSIRASTSGVATLGFEPPITPGLMLPVSWQRFSILETQPCDTLSCLDMTHGLTPAAAISTIFNRMWFGRGRPFMNTPPS